MTSRFAYLLDRIGAADFDLDPFPHLYLTDFLSDDDFSAVVKAPEVNLPPSSNIDELFDHLDAQRYERTDFPGCVRSKEEYLDWLNEGLDQADTKKTCEAQGLAFRLSDPGDETVKALDEFFRSPELHELLIAKFEIDRPVRMEGGVQKYLHGYEISPHPDIRKKALTWMLNVNPGTDADDLPIHTHYMTPKPKWSYITELWRNNPTTETCWVPWDWCSTVKQQSENNSVVFFAPRWDTIHAVRAHYDHLPAQRTQFYGNFWFDPQPRTIASPDHEDLAFTPVGQADENRDLHARLAEAEQREAALAARLDGILTHPAVRLARRGKRLLRGKVADAE